MTLTSSISENGARRHLSVASSNKSHRLLLFIITVPSAVVSCRYSNYNYWYIIDTFFFQRRATFFFNAASKNFRRSQKASGPTSAEGTWPIIFTLRHKMRYTYRHMYAAMSNTVYIVYVRRSLYIRVWVVPCVGWCCLCRVVNNHVFLMLLFPFLSLARWLANEKSAVSRFCMVKLHHTSSSNTLYHARSKSFVCSRCIYWVIYLCDICILLTKLYHTLTNIYPLGGRWL